jgi:hypothetical protein
MTNHYELSKAASVGGTYQDCYNEIRYEQLILPVYQQATIQMPFSLNGRHTFAILFRSGLDKLFLYCR